MIKTNIYKNSPSSAYQDNVLKQKQADKYGVTRRNGTGTGDGPLSHFKCTDGGTDLCPKSGRERMNWDKGPSPVPTTNGINERFLIIECESLSLAFSTFP